MRNYCNRLTEPLFPHQVFQNPASFIQEEILPRRLFQVNLIQQTPGSCHPVTLCHFVISLSELSQYAQPVESFNPNLEHGWVDLLLQPTRNFPVSIYWYFNFIDCFFLYVRILVCNNCYSGRYLYTCRYLKDIL